jgi:hypothetical protein
MQHLIRKSASQLGGGGIFLVQAMDYIAKREKRAPRVIVFTNEQDCDLKLNPTQANVFGKHKTCQCNVVQERCRLRQVDTH